MIVQIINRYFLESCLNSGLNYADTNDKTDQSMNVANKKSVSVSSSSPFNRLSEYNSTEQALEEESRDTLEDTISANKKDAKKNRERFAITKSYSIEVVKITLFYVDFNK